ncbi:MAG: dissimilatory sulfite reductase D family protein [Desulfovibrionaceae bacterium]
MAAAKQTVKDFLDSKAGVKSKFYFNDFTKLFEDAKPREVKKVLTEMVNEGVLIFWSSGSTTLYGLAGAGKQAAAEEGE